jgi:hypothetical protein
VHEDYVSLRRVNGESRGDKGTYEALPRALVARIFCSCDLGLR